MLLCSPKDFIRPGSRKSRKLSRQIKERRIVRIANTFVELTMLYVFGAFDKVTH